jgi:hypothetical protein
MFYRWWPYHSQAVRVWDVAVEAWVQLSMYHLSAVNNISPIDSIVKQYTTLLLCNCNYREGEWPYHSQAVRVWDVAVEAWVQLFMYHLSAVNNISAIDSIVKQYTTLLLSVDNVTCIEVYIVY